MGDTKSKSGAKLRQRLRDWRAAGAVFHLLSISVFVLGLLWLYPSRPNQGLASGQAAVRETELRQKLLEALDKIIRYENYYQRLYGRFTRDFTHLSLPENLSNGKFEDVRSRYEISVIESQAQRILVLAVNPESGDKATIDERFRINANFILPPPSKSYLQEEGERILRLGRLGIKAEFGAFLSYWNLKRETEDESTRWTVIGNRAPIYGEKFSDGASLSLFSSIRERMMERVGLEDKGRMPASVGNPVREEEVREWLKQARFAQFIYRQEFGRFARRWEDLDAVTGFGFSEKKSRADNLRVNPIEVASDDSSYTITLEGTKGDLLGEQFVMNERGELRQLRYTDALIEQLQQSTQILESTTHFQISEIPGENASAKLDRKKAKSVKSSN